MIRTIYLLDHPLSLLGIFKNESESDRSKLINNYLGIVSLSCSCAVLVSVLVVQNSYMKHTCYCLLLHVHHSSLIARWFVR